MTQHYPFFPIAGADAHAQRLPLRLRSNAVRTWHLLIGVPHRFQLPSQTISGLIRIGANPRSRFLRVPDIHDKSMSREKTILLARLGSAQDA